MPSIDPADLPTLKPWQAARELRTGIRHALVTFNSGGYNMSSLKKLVRSRNERRQQYAAQVDETVKAMYVSLNARRTKEARELLSSLVSYLGAERNYADSAFTHVVELPDHIGGSKNVSKSTLEMWNRWVQCLPTVEGVPSGREANVIRAIIAILRANNMGDVGTMTQVVQKQEGP
jgi:hypothetical protein